MSSRIGLVCSEELRPAMAGVGIRYFELSRQLAQRGFSVVLVSPGAELDPQLAERAGALVSHRPFEPGRLAQLMVGCEVVVAQGQLANDVVLELPHIPTVIDLYDPWLIENLHYHEQLGLDPYRNDHATWLLQLARGDFFLCSSLEQRLYYLGWLSALGRVNPPQMQRDPQAQRLIAVVPFGQPESPPPYESWLAPRLPGEKRILFGGLYDWYDPWPVLEALRSAQQPHWTLYFVRNPNATATPQRLLGEVERWSRRHGLSGSAAEGSPEGQVRFIDWAPFERRYDLARDVDVLVSTHRASLETDLSMRTRFFDALLVGCPIITSEGGGVGRLVDEHRAGWVVPAGDAVATERALRAILSTDHEEEHEARVARGRELAGRFSWQRVVEPLVEFCRAPWRDEHKQAFAAHLGTRAPADSLVFRLRRKVRRVFKQGLGHS